jgi:hypothetical protein
MPTSGCGEGKKKGVVWGRVSGMMKIRGLDKKI